jgi:predicted nicotinamide N-methyase
MILDTIDLINVAINNGEWNQLQFWAEHVKVHPTTCILHTVLQLCNAAGSIANAKTAVVNHF